MLDEFTDAFVRYLRTGTVGVLSDFCDETADPVRLRVYRNGFLRSCVEALRAGYPSVDRLVGEKRFPALARPYVEAHPPRVASLVEYGEDFPRFVEDARDTHRLDYLASFATLDRAWSEVWFAEDADTPDLETGVPGGGGRRRLARSPGDSATPNRGRTDPLRTDAPTVNGPHGRPAPRTRPVSNAHTPEAIAPSGVLEDAEALMNLRGRLAPWVRLVSLDHRALQAWSRLRQGELGQRIEVPRTPQHVLIRRCGSEILYRGLERPEHVFIAGIAAGQRCGEAAGAALEADAEFDLVAAFASLLHHRIATFEYGELEE